jgi:pimeloyl-ACP methyl ester carboxylesterase
MNKSIFDPFQMGAPLPSMSALGDYWVDAFQRTVLFCDVMRERSARYFEHKAMPVPNVLSFGAELVLDGRSLDGPVNYLLVRAVPPAGVDIDERKRPFMVVDPRAGHGPGIGGFKADSEIGVAMSAGHPCYFVGFTPDPEPGQTIEDIMRAEAVFLERIIELHPLAESKPCIIGNCQAGWAVLMMAATRPEICGPIIAAGTPLSYWAGVRGVNPMRYSGGLMGGSWLTALTSDLGNGKFDGSSLVTNFENQNPANTFWTKQYNLWSKVDTEAERYLEFEKWWGGHVNLNAEEMQWIVDQLFIGNRLATAEITTTDGVRIDLRSIRSPIVCFCSKGDNITPPQQALGWIVDLYEDEDDVRACNQTIVYAVHESVGHLGIFDSGGVARKEHQEFTSNIDLIDVLPPGLYEAVMTEKISDMPNVDLVGGDWLVRFEPRRLADVRAIVRPNEEDDRMFAAVRRLSEVNLGLYRTLLQPVIQASVSEQTADVLRKLQPSEIPYQFFSEAYPAMASVAKLAEEVRANRKRVNNENPFLQLQTAFSEQVIAAFDGIRDFQENLSEQLFLAIYGSPVVQAMLGLCANDEPPRRRPGDEPEELAFIENRIAELKSRIASGGAREASIRSLLYVGRAGRGADERAFALLRKIRAQYSQGLNLQQFKELVRDQYFMLMLDEEQALAVIPDMLPDDMDERRRSLDAVRKIANVAGVMTPESEMRYRRIEALFGVGPKSIAASR